jgi:hypothetical protein
MQRIRSMAYVLPVTLASFALCPILVRHVFFALFWASIDLEKQWHCAV